MLLDGLYEAERRRLEKICDGLGDYANPVFGEGPASALVMLIGEAPGAEEAKMQRPFVGQAGKNLDGFLLRAGIDRSELFVTNTVKYRPVKRGKRDFVNRTPAVSEIKKSLGLLKEEISAVSPAIIATLGNVPMRAVLELAGQNVRSIGELHGKRVDIAIDKKVYFLFPLYHPASMIYNSLLEETISKDTQELFRLVLEIRKERRYA